DHTRVNPANCTMSEEAVATLARLDYAASGHRGGHSRHERLRMQARQGAARNFMKEASSKPNIRYLGFESGSDGGRRLTFSVTSPGRKGTRVTFDIPGGAFSGEGRISFQESAALCYEKLRDLIARDSEVQSPLHVAVTELDIRQFRPRGRRAA